MKENNIKDLPNTLIFQKKGVQQFPGNQKVALYYCESLKKYFSITYNKTGIGLTESEYSLIEDLKKLEEVQEISFENGISLNVNKDCADLIIDLYESLSEGKEEFENFIKESDQNFLNLLAYSVKNKEKINA